MLNNTMLNNVNQYLILRVFLDDDQWITLTKPLSLVHARSNDNKSNDVYIVCISRKILTGKTK